MAPRLITKKQTRKINVPFAQFQFFGGACHVRCAYHALRPYCCQGAGGPHVHQRRKSAKCARGAREVKCKRGAGLTLWEVSRSWGGRYFSSNLTPPPRPLLAPSTAHLCTFLEVRGPLNRNSCNRQTPGPPAKPRRVALA